MVLVRAVYEASRGVPTWEPPKTVLDMRDSSEDTSPSWLSEPSDTLQGGQKKGLPLGQRAQVLAQAGLLTRGSP